jgi:hypothetical protein
MVLFRAPVQVIDAVYRAVGHNPGAAGNSRKNGPGGASRSTEVDDDEPYGGAAGGAGPGEFFYGRLGVCASILG